MTSTPEPGPGSLWATRANLLTGTRLAAAPALAWAILVEAWPAAAALFALAVATDLLDGRVARRFGESSALGGLLDHATDASFVVAGLAALVRHGEVPWLLPLLVAAAFLQYAVDSEAVSRRARPLRPSRLGRSNGIAYYVLVGIPVIREALGLGSPGAEAVHGLGLLLVASTLASMALRARSRWRERQGAS